MSRRFDTPALVSIEQTDENLFAHVEIDVAVGPGDSVRLHGEPIRVGFGTSARFTRLATVERASLLGRAWMRFCGHFALTHLYEVSFSPERMS